MHELAGDGGSVTGPGAHNNAGVATGAGGSLFDGSAVVSAQLACNQRQSGGSQLFDGSGTVLPATFDFPSDGHDLDGIGQLQLRFGYV
jgi:hypothetical protein